MLCTTCKEQKNRKVIIYRYLLRRKGGCGVNIYSSAVFLIKFSFSLVYLKQYISVSLQCYISTYFYFSTSAPPSCTIHHNMPGLLPPSMQLQLLSSFYSIFQYHCLKSSFVSLPDFHSTQCKEFQLPEMNQAILQPYLLKPNIKLGLTFVLIMTHYDSQESEPILHRSNMKDNIFFYYSKRSYQVNNQHSV